jgi:hypothetical protein
VPFSLSSILDGSSKLPFERSPLSHCIPESCGPYPLSLRSNGNVTCGVCEGFGQGPAAWSSLRTDAICFSGEQCSQRWRAERDGELGSERACIATHVFKTSSLRRLTARFLMMPGSTKFASGLPLPIPAHAHQQQQDEQQLRV